MTRGTQPGLRFRTRKLSPKQPLPVLREDEIDSVEYKELLENQFKVETGVEKSEENEYHLQQALAAALSGGSNDAKKIVPAPPAEESSEIKYDELYALRFSDPSTYIRFSQTVEECTGCQYNMTSEDDTYLISYNQKRAASSQCSEDDFEKIMEVFESTADHQTPFAAVDNTVIALDAMEFTLKQEVSDKARLFARDIYEYWKSRRQAAGNRPLQPSLKFEMHQDSDDGDPYVCFRRRDVRQTRKTRARDVQSTDKLKRLRKELEDGRRLVEMSYERELSKRKLLQVEKAVFEKRGEVKRIRQEKKIKADDEDLINQKPQKRKLADLAQMRGLASQLPSQRQLNGRTVEAELTSISDLIAQKENRLQMATREKLQQFQNQNQNHIDMTREPLLPIRSQGVNPSYRQARSQLMTPPTSESSDSQGDQCSIDGGGILGLRSAEKEDAVESGRLPAYRLRLGRDGRTWIDRKNLASPSQLTDPWVADRYKYDQDDSDDELQEEFDQYSTDAIKYRTSALSLASPPRRTQMELPTVSGTVPSVTAGSPIKHPTASVNQPHAPT